MGLSSSLYTGVSGLKGHGEQMGVIGNNISNVSTVGFKGSRMHFEDFMSQDINTAAGVGQVGRGVTTGAVLADFQQGAFETTNESTDVAIGGDGFFVVSPKGAEEQYYTRAGNFRFDKDGYLVDTKGNVVQGWEVRQDRDTGVAEDDTVQAADSGVQIQGVPKDIELTNFQSPPEATAQVDKMVNLDSNSVERSTASLRAAPEAGSHVVSYTVGSDTVYLAEADDRLKNADGTDYIVTDVDGTGEDYELEWDGSDFILVDGSGAASLDNEVASDHGVDVSVNQGFLRYNVNGDEVYLDQGGLNDGYIVDENGDQYTVEVEDPANPGTFGTYYILQNASDEFELEHEGTGWAGADGELVSDVDDVDMSQGSDPFFAMFDNWDATADEPLSDQRYAYQSTIKVYDANGSAYNMTTYFDPVRDENVVDASGGNRHWEYMVTIDPTSDNRSWTDLDDSKRGVLMTGSLTFNAAGDLTGQSAYTLNSQAALDDAGNLASWTEAEFSNNGYPVVTPNFLDEDAASFPEADGARNIEINFGLRNRTGAWDTGGTAADVGNDPSALPNFEDTERSALSTTQYSSASTTLFQSQDGYTSGFLQNVSIDRDGVMTGRYSNGQVLELYALTLADFNNQWGLRREGGNLFTETRSSGPALTGLAGTGSLGTVSANSLEMSNVDLATEFVKMITAEKGFQANSKTITTTDQMLSILIQMKR